MGAFHSKITKKLYVPRTVLEALGRHLFQDPSEKGGVLAQYNTTFTKNGFSLCKMSRCIF